MLKAHKAFEAVELLRNLADAVEFTYDGDALIEAREFLRDWDRRERNGRAHSEDGPLERRQT